MRVSQWNISVSAEAEAPQSCSSLFNSAAVFTDQSEALPRGVFVREFAQLPCARRLRLFVFSAITSHWSLKPDELRLRRKCAEAFRLLDGGQSSGFKAFLNCAQLDCRARSFISPQCGVYSRGKFVKSGTDTELVFRTRELRLTMYTSHVLG